MPTVSPVLGSSGPSFDSAMLMLGRRLVVVSGVFFDCLQKALGNDVTEESFDELPG